MATIFEDDFNSYNDGNLNGQGDWAGNAGPQVQAATAGNPEGEGVGKEVKANMASGQDWVIVKVGSATSNGRYVFYYKTNSIVYNDDYLSPIAAAVVMAYVHAIGSQVRIYNGTDNVIPGTVLANTWHRIEVEWESTTHKIRARLDDNDWSNWLNKWNNVTPDRMRLNFYSPGGAHAALLDYIAENPYTPPPSPAGRSYGYIFAKIYENCRNLAQRIFRIPALVNFNYLSSI